MGLYGIVSAKNRDVYSSWSSICLFCVVVQLVNLSSVPATLHSQEKVGQMSPLEELDGVNMVEPALDTNPPSRFPEAVGKAVKELMSDISGLSREEHAKLKRILHQFSDVISIGDGDLGHTNALWHKIDTGNAPPVHQPTRRLPFNQCDMVQKMLQGMLL